MKWFENLSDKEQATNQNIIKDNVFSSLSNERICAHCGKTYEYKVYANIITFCPF